MPNFDISSIRFGEPLYLWLQFVPALLLILWGWQAVRRRRDVQHYRARHRTPTPERISTLGRLPFWLCQLAALALTLLALSEPRAVVRLVRTAGVDIVVLQDGSASMYVRDVKPDRWQRSVRFLRVLGESLQWKDDRIALALFAHIAAPQVRLTTDPNTYFFFLDHLQRESPFPLSEDTTWDTNIELGIHWGARLVREGRRAATALAERQGVRADLGRPGVERRDREGAPARPLHRHPGLRRRRRHLVRRAHPAGPLEASQTTARVARSTSPDPGASLDRASLQADREEGNGLYFDLERDGDRTVATTIVEAARRRAGTRALEESFEELHRYCLLAAAWLFGFSLLLLRDRAELWLMGIGAGAALASVWALFR